MSKDIKPKGHSAKISHNLSYRTWVERYKSGLGATYYCGCHRILDATPATDLLIRCFCGRLMLLADYSDIPFDGYMYGGIECPKA